MSKEWVSIKEQNIEEGLYWVAHKNKKGKVILEICRVSYLSFPFRRTQLEFGYVMAGAQRRVDGFSPVCCKPVEMPDLPDLSGHTVKSSEVHRNVPFHKC